MATAALPSLPTVTSGDFATQDAYATNAANPTAVAYNPASATNAAATNTTATGYTANTPGAAANINPFSTTAAGYLSLIHI